MPGALAVVKKGRSHMHEQQGPAAACEQRGDCDSIKRLDLLSRRFTDEEIKRLSALQVKQGERPDALDRSVQEGRMQFVRWLVEHGRLGNDDRGDDEKPPLEPARGAKWPQECTPSASETAAAGAPAAAPAAGSATCEPMPNHAAEGKGPREDRRPPLLCVWACIRAGLARAAGIGSQVASWVFLPPESGEIDPTYLRDQYGNPWLYTDDPWPWTHFRNGW